MLLRKTVLGELIINITYYKINRSPLNVASTQFPSTPLTWLQVQPVAEVCEWWLWWQSSLRWSTKTHLMTLRRTEGKKRGSQDISIDKS